MAEARCETGARHGASRTGRAGGRGRSHRNGARPDHHYSCLPSPVLAGERESSIWQESRREAIEFGAFGSHTSELEKCAIACSHGFEVAIVLCLLAHVIGALKE